VPRRLALERPDTGADATRRDDEDRQQHDRQQCHLPREPHHHRDGERHGDHVRDDAGERRGECSLRTDHVVVQPADECAGVGSREERDRHSLDVVEHPAPQVEDEPFAELRRLPPFEQPDGRIDDGDDGDHRREGEHDARAASLDDGVDGAAGDERRRDAEHGAGRGEPEEGDDRPAMGAGEVPDPTNGLTVDVAPGSSVVLHRAAQCHPRVDAVHVDERKS
jgi:hypothetical protein